MKNLKKLLSLVLAVVMLSLSVQFMTFAQSAAAVEIQPYGPILHNSADDFNDFSKIMDTLTNGFIFQPNQNINPNAGNDVGFYTYYLWHDGSTTKLGDGTSTTTDTPNPWLTWQVTKGSDVDIVTYEHWSVVNTPENPLIKFSVSKDMVTWTEIDNANVAVTEVTDANKTEMGLDDIYTGEQLAGFGLTKDYSFKMPGDAIFVKATINVKDQPNNYAYNLTKFRARNGEELPENLKFKNQYVYTDDLAANLATADSYTAGAFEMTQLSSGTEYMCLSYGYAAGQASFAKPSVTYAVRNGSVFHTKAVVHDRGIKNDFDLKFYASADKNTWTPVDAIKSFEVAQGATLDSSALKNYFVNVPSDANYIKIEYPQDRDYTGTALKYMTTNDCDILHYGIGIISVSCIPPLAPDTTINFTGDRAVDLAKTAGNSGSLIDISSGGVIDGKYTVMYDYGVMANNDFDPLFLTYEVNGGVPAVAKAFLHQSAIDNNWNLKFYVSDNNADWQEITATCTIENSNTAGFYNVTYSIAKIPAEFRYLKIEYPQTKELNIQHGAIFNYNVALYEVQFMAPRGDLNGDSTINVLDAIELRTAILKAYDFEDALDIYCDGKIDILDLLRLKDICFA